VTYIGQLICEVRGQRRLTRRQVVELAGYRNLTKGLRRLDELESGRDVLPDARVLERFVAVLGIAEADVLLALGRDFDELDRPIRPYLVLRWLPGLYFNQSLPAGCSTREACVVARQIVAERNIRVCLVRSRIRGRYFGPEGTEFEAYGLPTCRFNSRLHGRNLQRRAARVPKEL
jgi:transcriptional regulator with XRE-family HTH domain